MTTSCILVSVAVAMLAILATANSKPLPDDAAETLPNLSDLLPPDVIGLWGSPFDNSMATRAANAVVAVEGSTPLRKSRGLESMLGENGGRWRRGLESIINGMQRGAERLSQFSKLIEDLNLSDEQIVGMLIDFGLPALKSILGLNQEQQQQPHMSNGQSQYYQKR